MSLISEAYSLSSESLVFFASVLLIFLYHIVKFNFSPFR